MAFFHARDRPVKRPILFGLECTLIVCTLETFTLNTSSTAWRISILLTSRSTSKEYLFWDIILLLFSVIIGRIMMS
jgi:hypothetical protein